MLKEHYKEKRERLDELLIKLKVPKSIWHSSTFLRSHLFIAYDGTYSDDVKEILEIVDYLYPEVETKI